MPVETNKSSSQQWISPNLSSGLGNRLFQVSAAMGAAEKYKRPLTFYLPRCHKSDHCPPDDIFKLFPSIPIVDSGFPKWHEITEKEFATYTPLPEIIPQDMPTVVRGFRQTEKYFPTNGISPDFRSALGARYEEITSTFTTTTSSSAKTTAFLHIRLGDYRILPHHYVNLESYWITCLKSLKAERLLIFSDEPDIVQQAFLPFFKQFPIREIQVIQNKNPLENLYMMSLCGGGAICANSTFSWWGAYLSRERHREQGNSIFMPAKWGAFSTPDLYPSWSTVIST